MRYMKEIATAVGTLGIAVGIGFVMQSTEAAQERYGKSARPVTPVESDASNAVDTEPRADVLLEVQEIELTSGTDASGISTPATDGMVQRVSAPATTDYTPKIDILPEAHGCEITAAATALSDGMVGLSLDAPCAVNERLTVHHNGLMFTQTTDARGQVEVTVPALTRQAVFVLAFSNGDGAVAQTVVPNLENYDRTALQWRGAAGFELHARAFGAAYGEAGHIWSGASTGALSTTDAPHGTIVRLGDPSVSDPMIAEVYTFPTATADASGTIDLSVEAEVTLDNCGLEVEAQSLEMMAGGEMKTQVLTLAVPGCDAVGSFLVLNNLVSDLKVAVN